MAGRTDDLLTVVVRGRSTGLGRRVLAELARRPGIEVLPTDDHDGRVDVIVDVVLADHDRLSGRQESVTAQAVSLLEDAGARRARALVVVSSAMVYGALANNPIPLTEAAVLRPDPRFVYARQLAAAEAAIEAWRVASRDRRVAMLRPSIPIAAGETSKLADRLTAGFGMRFGDSDPGAQFVHLDDLAAAVAIAVERSLDGVFNVAPDGSIPGERVRALSGRTWRLPLPGIAADIADRVRFRLRRGVAPGFRAYTREPWIVANDRLRAEGWEPRVTNEQAYVEGTEAPRWTTISPQRRQELALGLMAALIAGSSITILFATVRRVGRLRRR